MSCSSMGTILLTLSSFSAGFIRLGAFGPTLQGMVGPAPSTFHLIPPPEELPDCSVYKPEPQTLVRIGEQGVGYVLEMNVGFSELDHS